MADINETISQLATANEEFKNTINDRLRQLESKGDTDSLTDQKLENIKSDMLALQSTVTEFQKKSNRIGGDANADADAHRAAWTKWARKGVEGDLANLEAKTMSVGSDADGGFTVPETLNLALINRIVQLSPLRSLANVISTSSENVKFLYNKKGTDSAWVGETAARNVTNTPQLVEISPFYGEMSANPLITQKLLDDAGFDVEAFLANEIAEEFARAEGVAFLKGDGVSKPKGMLAGPTAATADAARAYGTIQHVATGAAAALPSDVKKYYELKYALKSQYRTGAGFLANSTMISTLMSLLDTQNRPLWQPSLVAGQPATFLGDPIWECQDMDGVAANTLPLAYGNYKSAYMIADRVGIRTLRDPYTNKPYVGFYTTARVGGVLTDSEAVKVLKVATA